MRKKAQECYEKRGKSFLSLLNHFGACRMHIERKKRFKIGKNSLKRIVRAYLTAGLFDSEK